MDYFYREKCLAYESGTANESHLKEKDAVLCRIENCPYGFYRLIGKINNVEMGMCASGGYVDQRRKKLDKKISDHPKFIDLRKTEPKS